jgi:hypothetical protein
MSEKQYRSFVRDMSASMQLGDSVGVDMIIMLIQKKYSREVARAVFEDARNIASQGV